MARVLGEDTVTEPKQTGRVLGEDRPAGGRVLGEEPVQANNAPTSLDVIKGAIDYFKGGPQRAEQRMANRPSMIKELRAEPNILKNALLHPIATPIKALGAGFEAAEAIPSDIALNLLKQDGYRNVIPDIQKTLKGERPAQLGDVLTGMGANEPIAATGGLMATGIKGMPTEILGKALGLVASPVLKGVGKVGSALKIPEGIAEAGHIMTGGVLPKDAVMRALKNPNILKKGFLAKEGEQAGQEFNTALEKARGNTLDLSNIPDNLAKSKAKTVRLNVEKIPARPQFNEPEQIIKTMVPNDIELSKMSPGEQNKIKNWLVQAEGRVKQAMPGGETAYSGANPKQNFTDVEKLKNEIDRDLKKSLYKRLETQRATGKPVDITPFELHAENIRNELQNAMKEQSAPDVAKAIERVHQLKLNQQASGGFRKDTMSIMRAWPIKAALLAAGVPTGGATLAALPATVPQVWKGGILAGQKIGQTLSENPQYLSTLLRKRKPTPEE